MNGNQAPIPHTENWKRILADRQLIRRKIPDYAFQSSTAYLWLRSPLAWLGKGRLTTHRARFHVRPRLWAANAESGSRTTARTSGKERGGVGN